MPRILTREQVREHDRDGVLFPIAVLSPAEVARARASLDGLTDALGGRMNLFQMRHLHLFHRWAYDLACHPTVLDAIEDVLGPNVLVHSTSMFVKFPGDGTFVSWHQDGCYMAPSSLEFTSAWIALTDSSASNGCMRVIRGTHVGGIIRHTDEARSPQNLVSGLQVEAELDESRMEDVVLAPGEMSLHNVAILHGSNPNHSDRFRIGFAIRYMTPEVSVKLDHFPVILARGVCPRPHFRLLLDPPRCTVEEGIRGQAELAKWVAASRATAERVPLPDDLGFRWTEPAAAKVAESVR